MKRLIAYIRKSTDKGQANSYDRQLAIINDFVAREGFELVETYVEQASGSSKSRPALNSALAASRRLKAPVIVSSVSRLSRSVSFGSALLEDSSLKIIVADLGVEADPFLLNILLCVAQKERELISKRTKQALAVVKASGKQLGNPNWNKSISLARQAKSQNTSNRDTKYLDIIGMIKSSGVSSYRGIARRMNDMDISSPTGKAISGQFVRRVMLRA